MSEADERAAQIEEVWRSYMTTGKTPDYFELPWYEHRAMRALARSLPSDPRCKVCYYPFGGIGGQIVRSLIKVQPSTLNPHLCNVCERFAEAQPGGAELVVTLLFVDIRDSTPLAASMSSREYGRLIDRFYTVTTNIIYQHGGMVEKLVGDEVAAFFVPGFTRDGNHALAAVEAAKEILRETGHESGGEPSPPLGAGVHTGEAYVGAVGEPGKNINIAVLGDNVNVGSRLAGQALTGQIVLSQDTLDASGLSAEGLEARSLSLKGKEQPVEAYVYSAR